MSKIKEEERSGNNIFFVAPSWENRITDRNWQGTWYDGEMFGLINRGEKTIGSEFTIFALHSFFTFLKGPSYEVSEIKNLLVPSSSEIARHLRATAFENPDLTSLSKLTLSKGSAEILEKFSNYEPFSLVNWDTLLIKNPDLVEIEKVMPQKSVITFRPKKALEVRETESLGLPGVKWINRHYTLEIEPLDLEVEGLPKIIQLYFFVSGFRDNFKKFERNGYPELLKEPVGREFTIEINKWYFSLGVDKSTYYELPNGKYEVLFFSEDNQFSKIVEGREIENGDEEEPEELPNPNPDEEPEIPDNSDPNQKAPNGPEIPTPPDTTKIDQIKAELNTALATNDADTIDAALKKYQAELLNTSDDSLKQLKQSAETKLEQLNQGKFRQTLKEEVQTVMSQEGISENDLDAPTKQKFSSLENDGTSTTRDEIIQAIAKQKLTKLITELQTALHSKDKNKIKSKVGELRDFVNKRLEYRKTAVNEQQSTINNLFAEADQATQNNEDNSSSFFRMNNPWMWASALSLIGLALTLIWIFVSSQKRKEVEASRKIK